MTIQQNLSDIKTAINKAKEEGGSGAGAAHLIAVSKTRSVIEIAEVLEAGHRLFGENRVQEAAAKWPELRLKYSDIELHLIGPLQSNKAADAVACFDVIETVDRPKIASAIAKEMKNQNKHVKLFVQVNVGEEPQKAGVAPQDLSLFLAQCRDEFGLTISGLMCIPPVEDNPALHFAMLREIAKRNGLSGLSMGMSGDFETAVALGATHVRVGTAIFGARDYG